MDGMVRARAGRRSPRESDGDGDHSYRSVWTGLVSAARAASTTMVEKAMATATPPGIGWRWRSLIPNRLYRIGERRPRGKHADGGKGDGHGDAPGEDEGGGPDVYPVGEVGEPLGHDQVSERHGEQESDDNEPHEIARKQHDDARRRGAEHLSDTDLLQALCDAPRCEAEK